MAKNEDEDDLQEQVEAMADRLGLKGRDRTRYVHEHMTRGGYRAVPQYVRGDDDDDDDDDAFFGRSRRRRTRDSDDDSRGRSRRSRSRDNDGDDWY